MNIKDVLIQKLQDKTAKIGILGMGYVGMPLAVVFAEKGFSVLGIDPTREGGYIQQGNFLHSGCAV